MAADKLQLSPPKGRRINVIKADGSMELFIHTKIVGTIANALSLAGQSDINIAEELAEAVTFFIYHQGVHRNISAGEIFSIIKTVLADTGFEEAAAALGEHSFERKLRRSRVEVIKGLADVLAKPENLYKNTAGQVRSRWDKSRIVEDVIAGYALPRRTARVIAAMVEEKVLNMDLPLVSSGLVKQLVISAAAAVINAEQQLQKS